MVNVLQPRILRGRTECNRLRISSFLYKIEYCSILKADITVTTSLVYSLTCFIRFTYVINYRFRSSSDRASFPCLETFHSAIQGVDFISFKNYRIEFRISPLHRELIPSVLPISIDLGNKQFEIVGIGKQKAAFIFSCFVLTISFHWTKFNHVHV